MPRSRLLVTLLAALLVVSGCAVGPETGPRVVRGEDGGGPGAGENPGPPALSAPQQDLDWGPCDRQRSLDGLTAPGGVTIECAQYEVPLEPETSSHRTLQIGAVKASTEATPDDAIPIVLTSGTDMPSSRVIFALAGGRGAELLDTHPVVAVDRRGIGLSAPIDCLSRTQRAAIETNGGSTRTVYSLDERVDRLTEETRVGADQCNETMEPFQGAYSLSAAAADLEALREKWGVDHLALWGLGNGSSEVLAYSAAYADHVGRVLLDTPVPYLAPARGAGQAWADGIQKSLDAFVTQCVAPQCAQAGNLRQLLDQLLTGTSRQQMVDTEVLAAITYGLAFPGPDGPDIPQLAGMVDAAARGETAALEQVAAQSARWRLSDGLIMSRCNDLIGKPGTGDIPGLVEEWRTAAPLSAKQAALDIARCDGWGTAAEPGTPTSFPTPPLVLVGRNDPVNGGTGSLKLAPLMIQTGADAKSVTWSGIGYSVLANSECAAQIVTQYLGDDELSGPTDRACPA